MRSGFIIILVVCGALAASVTRARATINFTRVDDVPVGSTPVAIASGDLDGDGKVDLVVANSESHDVSILYGKGDGTFDDSTPSIPLGTSPAAVAIGRFNDDAQLDIVVTDDIDNTVNVLLNQGGRAFGSPLKQDTGRAPEVVVVADFNHDDILDVATADDFDDTVTVLFGVGDGTLMPGTSIKVGSAPLGLVAVDLDGDGNLDLVAANSSGGPDSIGTITVLKGAHDGSFTAQPEIESNLFDGPAAIVSGDFDGNGKPDLATVNQGSITSGDLGKTVTVLLNDGSGTGFQVLSPVLTVGNYPTGIVAADLDGDGKLDLATSNNFDDNVSVLIGSGNGTFAPKVDFSVAPPLSEDAAPAALVVADLDGNGKLDLATVNEDDDTASILLNAGNVAAPVCAGDCDGGGDVTVNELIVLVNIALGNVGEATCAHGIPSATAVDITLIITAVNNTLGMCPLVG